MKNMKTIFVSMRVTLSPRTLGATDASVVPVTENTHPKAQGEGGRVPTAKVLMESMKQKLKFLDR